MKTEQGQLTQLVIHVTWFHNQLKIVKNLTHFQHNNKSFTFQDNVIIRDPMKEYFTYNMTIYIYIKVKFNKGEPSLTHHKIA